MDILEIIEKKQNGVELTPEEIKFAVDGYTEGEIPAYQMSAFLMSVYFKGMTDEEATNMALIMRDSGDVLKLGDVKGFKVDKHSTGGVGDKTTLVLGPMLAACGTTFAKMSGRGLGHTGGTIDKLESIPGFNTQISIERFKENLNNIGISVVGQTGHLAPADKKIYALRDVTSTVASIPLIASSIMSKKLASGANAICLDVKVGHGAFMKNVDDARDLAKLMVSIGKKAGRTMTAILTDMSSPLGNTIGNILEVKEAIETLKGAGPEDLEVLCSTIAAYLLMDADPALDYEKAYKKANSSLHDLSAFNKFIEMIEAQGGDKSYIINIDKFPVAEHIASALASKDGYITEIDALMVGEAACLLGAGRRKLDDEIDFTVGIRLLKKPGDLVKKDDVIAEIHYNSKGYLEASELLSKAFTINETKIEKELIIDIIR